MCHIMPHTYRLEICPLTEDHHYVDVEYPEDNENAGIDIYLPSDSIVGQGESQLLRLGIQARMVCLQTLKDVHYKLLPRSSIYKYNLIMMNSVGLIDRGYRGELGAPIHNLGKTECRLEKGQRLFQIVSPDLGNIVQVKIVKSLPITQRGIGGFGSTGK